MLGDLKFYLSLFFRRIHYFLVVAAAISAFGLTVAYTLPPVYEAEAQLLVESAQIPGDLASSTVRAETPEILQIIRQRLLTRANLLEIAREFEVYADRPNLAADDIVEDMRRRISMTLPRSRDAAAFVTISFEAPNGQMSARVTNDLVTRVLAANIEMRKATTGQTLEFFRQSVASLDQELADQGQRILEFKLEHKDALPESLNYRRERQNSLLERSLQIERELASLRDRRERLQTLFETTGRVVFSEDQLSPEQKRLQTLNSQLSSALILYSEKNPKIAALRAQVEHLEAVVAEQSANNDGTKPELSPYEIQMEDLEGQMNLLADQNSAIKDELSSLQKSIEETPSNAVQLGTLERDYENLRVQYSQATADLNAARTGDQIEAQSRGQRITVIEQAVAPRAPTSPNRKKIAMAGVGGGILAGLGLVALIELLNGSIRRPVDISNRLGITPFITIPYIRTRGQKLFRRLIIIAALLVVIVGIPGVLYYLHINYLPMDLMIERALDKTGLSDLLAKLGLDLR